MKNRIHILLLFMTTCAYSTNHIIVQDLTNDINSEFPYGLLESAEDGDSYSQYLLAGYYQSTTSGFKNLERAAYWYENSAAQGDPDAALELGMFYSAGSTGLKKSCELSVYWATKAAEGGIVEGWNNVAWELVVCDDKSFRNAKKALEIMKEYGEQIGQTAGVLDTFAAIYAELGEFEKAKYIQETAILLVGENGNKARLESMKERLNHYIQNKTWTGFGNSNPEMYIEQ